MACGPITPVVHLQAPDASTFDEVMVVAYKHRLQFFKLALLTPGYWPLTCALPCNDHHCWLRVCPVLHIFQRCRCWHAWRRFLRDEGLKDGMLHAVTPVALYKGK